MEMVTQLLPDVQTLWVILIQFLCAFFNGTIVYIIFKKSEGLTAHTKLSFIFIMVSIVSMISILTHSKSLFLLLIVTLLFLKKDMFSYWQLILLLWSITGGYCIGSQMFIPALILSIFMCCISWYTWEQKHQVYQLFVTCFDDACEKQVVRYIQHESEQYKLLSKTISEQGILLELQLMLSDIQLMNPLSRIKGVEKISMERSEKIW